MPVLGLLTFDFLLTQSIQMYSKHRETQPRGSGLTAVLRGAHSYKGEMKASFQHFQEACWNLHIVLKGKKPSSRHTLKCSGPQGDMEKAQQGWPSFS